MGGGGATGICWIEARDDADNPKMQGTAPNNKKLIIKPKMSIMPRFKRTL